MTERLVKAMANLSAAQAEFHAALHEELAAKPLPVPTPPARTPAKTATPARAAAPTPTLPAPLTKAPNALSDETRESNMPEAINHAVKVLKMVGPDSPMLRQGLMGQLAQARIPYDDQLVNDAIEQAKAKL